MNKKIIIGIIVVIIIAVVGIVLYFLLNNKENENNNLNENTANETTQNNSSESNNNNVNSNRKILVVYYSATGSTEKVAKQIADDLDAYLFEIVPKDIYTSDDLDWTDDNSRVSKEHDDESLRNVELTTTKVNNWDTYDTILIGYPIWWGIAAWPVNTFVASNNFDGKTVIPFCTSASSGLGQSGDLLAEIAGTGDWQEGKRFSSGVSASEIKNWTDNLK